MFCHPAALGQWPQPQAFSLELLPLKEPHGVSLEMRPWPSPRHINKDRLRSIKCLPGCAAFSQKRSEKLGFSFSLSLVIFVVSMQMNPWSVWWRNGTLLSLQKEVHLFSHFLDGWSWEGVVRHLYLLYELTGGSPLTLKGCSCFYL